MAKAETITNWDKFEQQGKRDAELQHEFDQLLTFYTKNLPVNIFIENSDHFRVKNI